MADLNIDDAKTLATISKRLEEVKGKLEGGQGQLNVDDLADLAIEYKVLRKAREKLLYKKDMAGILIDGCS